MNTLMVIIGTRPEIIKMAPIIRALRKARLPSIFVHCGQHYDYNMSQQFIENLDFRRLAMNTKSKRISKEHKPHA